MSAVLSPFPPVPLPPHSLNEIPVTSYQIPCVRFLFSVCVCVYLCACVCLTVIISVTQSDESVSISSFSCAASALSKSVTFHTQFISSHPEERTDLTAARGASLEKNYNRTKIQPKLLQSLEFYSSLSLLNFVQICRSCDCPWVLSLNQLQPLVNTLNLNTVELH